MDIDAETALTVLQSGETDRVNDLLDAVENTELTVKTRLLSECFEDCRRLYEDAADGYKRQSVVRFFSAADPHLATANAHGNTELESDDLNLTGDVGNYRDALVEFYLTAIQDDDGRVRNSAKRELKSLATRYEMFGEQARLDALFSCLDELAEDATGKTREAIVDARTDVQAHARSGGTGLRSTFKQLLEETNEIKNN